MTKKTNYFLLIFLVVFFCLSSSFITSVKADNIVGSGSDSLAANSESGSDFPVYTIQSGHSYRLEITSNSFDGFWPGVCNGTCLTDGDFTSGPVLQTVNGNFGIPYTSQNLADYPSFTVFFTDTNNATNFAIYLRCHTGDPCSWNYVLYDISTIPTSTPNPTPTLVPTPTPTPTTSASPEPTYNDWPVFQRDPEHTGFNSGETILKPPLNILWVIDPDGTPISLNSMVISGNTLYARSDSGKIYSIDVSSGAINWQIQGQVGSGNLAVANNIVYSTNWCSQCSVNAYDATTGQSIWTAGPFPLGAFGINVVDNVVYFGSQDNHVRAVDANTGNEIWDHGFRDSVFDVPAISNNRLYFADYQVDGVLFSLDATTGSTIWSSDSQSICGYSSPTVAANLVFMGISCADRVEAYDSEYGNRVWYSVPLSPVITASTSYAYDSVYTKTTNGPGGALVARLNPAIQSDGLKSNLLWEYNDSAGQNPAFIQPPVVIANGVAYEAASNNTVNALDAQTGNLLWNYNVTGAIQSLIIADHTLFIGSDDGKIYAFSTNQSPTPTPTPTPTPSLPPTPTPTPTSTPVSTTTVTFDDRAPNTPLGGSYSGIDWGNGAWDVDGAISTDTTNSVSFHTSSVTSEPFSFVSPQVLISTEIYSNSNTSAMITLSCNGNPTISAEIPANNSVVFTTNWTIPCTTITVTSSNSWNTNLDNIVYGTSNPWPNPTPTPTSPPGNIVGNPKQGALLDVGDSGYINGSKFTTGSLGGTTTSMSVFVGNIDSGLHNKYQMAIYSDINGYPGSLIAKTGTGTLTPISWNTLSITTTLNANTSYWLMYNTNASSNTDYLNNMYYDVGPSGISAWAKHVYGSWPTTFPTATMDITDFSIYVSYY